LILEFLLLPHEPLVGSLWVPLWGAIYFCMYVCMYYVLVSLIRSANQYVVSLCVGIIGMVMAVMKTLYRQVVMT
jgi:hypothetical protein